MPRHLPPTAPRTTDRTPPPKGSPFSPRAAFLSLSLGEGRSTILTEQDVALLPKGVPAALTDAIDALA